MLFPLWFTLGDFSFSTWWLKPLIYKRNPLPLEFCSTRTCEGKLIPFVSGGKHETRPYFFLALSWISGIFMFTIVCLYYRCWHINLHSHIVFTCVTCFAVSVGEEKKNGENQGLEKRNNRPAQHVEKTADFLIFWEKFIASWR